jgi:hypothetical protein
LFPEDVLRHVFSFAPSAWLTIDISLEIGVPPRKPGMGGAVVCRNPERINHGNDGSAVVLRVGRERNKSVLVIHDRDYRFRCCKSVPFYYPVYETT